MTFHVTAWKTVVLMFRGVQRTTCTCRWILARPSLVQIRTTFITSSSRIDSGNYHITAKDENNCFIYYDQDRSHTLRSPSPIVLDSVVTTPITCFDAEDGVIEIFAHGGTISNNDDPNYTPPQLIYSIDGGVSGSWSKQNECRFGYRLV